MIDIPEFVDREKEIKELKAVLSGRPNEEDKYSNRASW